MVGAMANSQVALAAVVGIILGFASSINAQGLENTTNYNILLRFQTPVTAEVEAVFVSAKSKWETIILSDIESFITIQEGQDICGITAPATEEVDDLLIYVNVHNIDGPGNVLANAGPCAQDSLNRVRVGIMNFDLADLENLIQAQRAQTVVLHEMAHVLGFGTLWESLDLINTDGFFFQTYKYEGEEGNIGNEEIGMQGEAIIENEGQTGTAKSHWKENVYTIELMTGFVSEDGAAPLSLLTIRSLVDLGYSVDITQADDFEVDEDIADEYGNIRANYLRGSAPSAASLTSEGRPSYGNDVLSFPLQRLPETPKRR
jgi:hypothetical protein